MLFKLSINSIKKNLRDYAIYFFTLVIGVSIFYVFNAIGDQVTLLNIYNKGTKWILDTINQSMSTVSIFISIILGLLIVYASRFIMKRRHKEFALYMTLGMSKSKISIILLMETIIIGIGSIIIGIIIGTGLSQLMSAFIINLFDADMSQYKFIISSSAIFKTILYFVVIYLVVIIFNNLIIGRFKIINLMYSGKKSEKIKLKNPILCTIIFILAAIALAYAYFQVGWNYNEITYNSLLYYIVIGAVSTFLIFWSISGLIFFIMSARKKKYYKRLNSFTFRQISSKINTMVTSMTIICLMLFITICTISSGFAVNGTLNSRNKEQHPTDISISFSYYPNESSSTDDISHELIKYFSKDGFNIQKYFNDTGFDPQKYFKEYTTLNLYHQLNSPYGGYMKLSDHNKLMKFFGKETITLKENEFAKICGSIDYKSYLDKEFQNQKEITISGNTLISKYDECKYVNISPDFYTYYVVPDNIIGDDTTCTSHFIGNYTGNNKKMEKQLFNDKSLQQIFSASENLMSSGIVIYYRTKLGDLTIVNSSRAATTLLYLYIGFVFLITCGATLALKNLSDITDSSDRYKTLRKIGADEKNISKSIFRQIGFFFSLPLLIACIHSIFGMKFALNLIQLVSLPNLISAVALNAVIIILIYGGYFLITYHCCKNMIKNKK